MIGKPLRHVLFCIGLMMCSLSSYAQPASNADSPSASTSIKYWVFLTNKQAPGEPAPVLKTNYLTERTLERRQRRGRNVSPQYDWPVSNTYLATLNTMGVEPLVKSRWLNAISAYLTPAQIETIQTLAFVREIRPVGQQVTPQFEPQPTPIAQRLAEPAPSHASVIDYGASRTQLEVVNAIVPLENGFNGAGVRIGYLDTTFDFDHPAMKHIKDDNRLIEVRDFAGAQTDKHGLRTTSVALGFDEGNLVGPCYGAEVLAASTEFAPSETNQEEDNLVAGLEWMESMGADVVNISLGYNTFDAGQQNYTYDDMNGDTAVTTRAADLAAAMGLVVVVSAGNEGTGSWHFITSPADGDSVITVGAVRPDSSKASFSSFGPTSDDRIKPDVSAMGSSVRTAFSNGSYISGGGTSFSSPMVAGVVCQILQANPNLNPIEVRGILRETASQADAPDNELGWGIINALAAVEQAGGIKIATEEAEVPAQTTLTLSTVYPNPFQGHTTIQFEVNTPALVRLRVYDVLGRPIHTLFEGTAQAGVHTARFEASTLPAGLYIIQLEGAGQTISQKIIHTK